MSNFDKLMAFLSAASGILVGGALIDPKALPLYISLPCLAISAGCAAVLKLGNKSSE